MKDKSIALLRKGDGHLEDWAPVEDDVINMASLSRRQVIDLYHDFDLTSCSTLCVLLWHWFSNGPVPSMLAQHWKCPVWVGSLYKMPSIKPALGWISGVFCERALTKRPFSHAIVIQMVIGTLEEGSHYISSARSNSPTTSHKNKYIKCGEHEETK